MILDSSALVAIALDEPDRESFVTKINAAELIAGQPLLAKGHDFAKTDIELA